MCHFLKISLFLLSCLSLQYADARYEKHDQDSKAIVSQKTKKLMFEALTGFGHGLYLDHCERDLRNRSAVTVNMPQAPGGRPAVVSSLPSYAAATSDGVSAVPYALPASSDTTPLANGQPSINIHVNNIPNNSSTSSTIQGSLASGRTGPQRQGFILSDALAKAVPAESIVKGILNPTKSFKEHPRGATLLASVPLRALYNRDFSGDFCAEGALAHGLGQYAARILLAYIKGDTIDMSFLVDRLNSHMVIGGLVWAGRNLNK